MSIARRERRTARSITPIALRPTAPIDSGPVSGSAVPLPPVTGTVELAPATVPFEALPPVVAVAGLFVGVGVGEAVLVAVAEAAGD